MQIIQTAQAPAAIGPYSQAIKVNGLIFCSGQIPLDPATMQVVEGDIRSYHIVQEASRPAEQ